MRTRLPFIVLALAILLPAHQLVYLVTYGWWGVERALSSVGHDAYWLSTGALVSLALAIGLLLGLRRWLTLRADLRSVGGRPRNLASIDWPVFRATVLRLAPRLALAALALFLVQENLEHYIHHAGHVPGLGVLFGPEYVATIPIFALVATLVAVITSLLRLGLATLARLVDGLRRLRPERKSLRPIGRRPSIHRWSHHTPDLGRAPPRPA